MIIDKKGKLFGKINIIDFLILLVLVVAILAVGVRFLGQRDASAGTQTLRMQFYAEEIDEWVADKVQVGSTLYDDTYKIPLGTVTAVETGEPRTWGITSEGQYVSAPREGYCSILITGEMPGTKTATGAEIEGNRYGVGHSMVLYAGDAKIYLRVHDIDIAE